MDCGCPFTSVGTRWISKFTVWAGLREDDLQRRPSTTNFVFGDGILRKSRGIIRIPVKIDGRTPVMFEAEEIDADILLLISNS